MNKPLPKPLNLPRPPRPVDPNRVGEGRNSYKAEVMQLWEKERIGDFTHRAFFYLEQENKPRVELARKVGKNIDDALDGLVIMVEASTGLTHHKRFVRLAVQAARADMERTQKRKDEMRAALAEESAPKGIVATPHIYATGHKEEENANV